MSIEQKINYQLNKYPAVKKVIKRAYQTGMYAISKKIKSEGDITRISPDDIEHEYFFGYYDKSPWDISDRYMLCVKANDTWSDVSPREKADILLIDTQKSESDSSRVKKIAETRAWNVQQSCMLQWLGPDFSSRVLYNDYRDGKYVSVILTLATMEEKVIPAAVYSVSNDGKFALTLDFSRLYELRPGYGYYNVPEKTKGVALPDTTAIWKVDLETGEVIDLLKYTDFANFQPRLEMKEKGAVHKVNHIMISPNGKRFMVLYRWFCGQRKYTRLVTCNVDGTDMYVLSDDDMVSHCFWKNNSAILAFENKKKTGPGYYLMKDKTDKYIHCWPQFSNDGHPSYSPDGKLIVTDSYPDRTRIASINLMDGDERKKKNTTIARVFAPFKYDNDTRCDLHPRWNHAGDKVCFDSVFEGHRGLYVVDVFEKRRRVENVEGGKKPLISIIVPVYNVERYLDRCVQSLISQTYENLEIILVDDGSPDRCPKLCDEYEKKYSNIRVIHKENGGLSSARNAGMAVAKGDYIGFVDSDDWVEPTMYAYLYEILIDYDADISDICCIQTDGNKKIINTDEKINIYSGDDILIRYLERGLSEKKGAPYTVWRKLYKKKVINGELFKEGILNEDICYNYSVMRRAKKVVESNQIFYYYFQNSAGISGGKLKKKDLVLLKVTDELVELAGESDNKLIVEYAKMKRARSDFSLLMKAALNGIEGVSDKQLDIMQKNLRKNLKLIFKSPMSITRKLICLAFAIDRQLTGVVFSRLKKIIQ